MAVCLFVMVSCCLSAGPGDLPALDVRYVNASRSAFEVVADGYGLVGELRKPHRLVDAETGEVWLTLEVETADATYSTAYADAPSRINVYRRGPYFCEVHWLDLRVATPDGEVAPLKGDLALYCYPDKLLASITWHATKDFPVKAVRMAKVRFDAGAFTKGSRQRFAFPLFNETGPLPDSAFDNLRVVAPMRYDAVRGCYTIGSLSTGGFQGHFFHHPNRYDTVRFSVANDATPRTVYICHENTGGDKGSVEGGVLLDEDGHPLPVVVQISKNFAGEKEEPFYNPPDTSFSETYFPLHLEANETRTLSSLHLYQNWGRHMVKQFSSLGAWMGYWHSSTGVTETTCYVPFKFDGNLRPPGRFRERAGGPQAIAIADFRAMSQSSFWGGQPQHDNIAGHSFLTYKVGDEWQYLVYRGTTYRSTGPNWMDIGLEYLSSDGKIRAAVDTFELPQADELRNFIHVRYEVLEPLTVSNAPENFRLLTVASWTQGLRYTHFAATGTDDIALNFGSPGFNVRAVPLPPRNAFAALYGEPKGSNAIVLQKWSAPETAGDPTAGVWCGKKGDTRLVLAPSAEELVLKPGDLIEFDAFWLPYGEVNGAATPRNETVLYGSAAPRITDVLQGTKEADFPATIRAEHDKAEFTLAGGRDLVPVIVTGLSGYRWPRLFREEERGWREVFAGRAGHHDGIQVFTESEASFGAVFLVPSDGSPQTLRVTAGVPFEKPPERIAVNPLRVSEDELRHVALIQAPFMSAPIQLRFPETLHTDGLDFIDHKREDMPPRVDPAPLAQVWNKSEGGSIWFEWRFEDQVAGGRLSPNEDDVDLEFWVGNRRKASVNVHTQFCPVLAGTMFEDRALERTWLHTGGKWVKMAETDRGAGKPSLCHYPVQGGPAVDVPLPWGAGAEVSGAPVAAVTSEDGAYVFAIAWPHPGTVVSNADIPCVHADPQWPSCPPGRRVHVRGKVYLLEGTLEDVLRRVRREILPLSAAPPL